MNYTNQPNRQRLRNGLAFLLAAAGVGLCGYAAMLWRELPGYSEQDIQRSTELNLSIDLSRVSNQDPLTESDKDAMRKRVRSEVDADIARERQWPLQWLRTGLILISLAALMAWPSLPIFENARTKKSP